MYCTAHCCHAASALLLIVRVRVRVRGLAKLVSIPCRYSVCQCKATVVIIHVYTVLVNPTYIENYMVTVMQCRASCPVSEVHSPTPSAASAVPH